MKPKVKMTDRINGLIKGKATIAPQISQRDQYAKIGIQANPQIIIAEKIAEQR